MTIKTTEANLIGFPAWTADRVSSRIGDITGGSIGGKTVREVLGDDVLAVVVRAALHEIAHANQSDW